MTLVLDAGERRGARPWMLGENSSVVACGRERRENLERCGVWLWTPGMRWRTAVDAGLSRERCCIG